MTVTLDQLREWMEGKENEHLEFKKAENNFHFETLVKYCSALANERGGRMVLGVTNTRPRRVVGTNAFDEIERTKAGLTDRLRLRIDVDELRHHDGRVLVFSVPSRPLGMPIPVEGAYWMRAGESLVPMTPDLLKRIFAETGPDFSAEICERATLADLDPAAIAKLRELWARSSGNAALLRLSVEQLLRDAELLDDKGGVTYAALVLLGTHKALGKHLAQAEIVFEFRSTEASGPAQHRRDFREGFLNASDAIWTTISHRNDVQHVQLGLFMANIPTFGETAVREALLNAVAHRDYRLSGSVFLRQYQRRLEIVSPGGFPPGITSENVLWMQAPRNRRIAETFAKCGLVERSGQGVNRMFEESIKQSKPRPDFAGTDDYQVFVTLRGEVQDPAFLRFFEKLGQKRVRELSTEDLLVLDLVHREVPIDEQLRPRLASLVEQGIVERVGRGRGVKYLLARRLYEFLGKKGVYTRRRGLDRRTHAALLLRHIKENADEGSRMNDLMQVLPELSRGAIKTLLDDLREGGRIRCRGRTRSALWFPIGSKPKKANRNQ